MQVNAVRRAAAVVLTTVLLAAAGHGAANAADPQWESDPPTAAQP
jgi:hypothetical protein